LNNRSPISIVVNNSDMAFKLKKNPHYKDLDELEDILKQFEQHNEKVSIGGQSCEGTEDGKLPDLISREQN
jgi:hypothetical protein